MLSTCPQKCEKERCWGDLRNECELLPSHRLLDDKYDCQGLDESIDDFVGFMGEDW
jgi:hypothetical protein